MWPRGHVARHFSPHYRPFFHSRRLCHPAVLLCVVATHLIALADAKFSARLLGGQLTWEINPNFEDVGNFSSSVVYGNRQVTFTLFTALEMDAKCNYSGPLANCSGIGSDEERRADSLGWLCIHDCNSDSCIESTRKMNEFEILGTRHINGLNVAFGKLSHTVTALNETSAMIAYFESKNTKLLHTLPQCELDITTTALPCAVNVEDEAKKDNPDYKLRQQPVWIEDKDTGLDSEYFYDTFPDAYKKVEKEIFFETFARLCARKDFTCHIQNFYSPVPIIPPIVEVAVTPYTQKADREPSLADKEGWHFKYQTETSCSSEVCEVCSSEVCEEYFAPHPPFHVSSYDLDGHKMAHVSLDWSPEKTSTNKRWRSNRGLECFGNSKNAKNSWPFIDDEVETEEKYQHEDMREREGTCNIFYDMDGSGGSQLKFDFNFGGNCSKGRYCRPDGDTNVTSEIFGNDLNRCRGTNGSSVMLACNPEDPGEYNAMACFDSDTGLTTACSGNLMFTHHFINTVDLPWVDVDNIDARYTVPKPRWESSEGKTYSSSMVRTLLSAYMCFAGTANQPPRFMKNLEPVPNASDWLRVPGVRRADYLQPEDTEITCTAGELCVFPLYAQDFLLNENGRSCVTNVTQHPIVNDDPYGETCTPETLPLPREPCTFGPGEDESARYQSTDVVRIEMAPGWETYGDGLKNQGADLITAYCSGGPDSQGNNTLPCVRDSDCPEGWGTCIGYERKHGDKNQAVPGYCINPLGSQGDGGGGNKGVMYDPPKKCQTDVDCPPYSKCAIPSCESYTNKNLGGKGGLGSVKCFYKEHFKREDAGKVITRCFVATDPQGDRSFQNNSFWSENPWHPRMWDGKCNRLGSNERPGWGPWTVNPLVPALSIVKEDCKAPREQLLHGCAGKVESTTDSENQKYEVGEDWKTYPVHSSGKYARTCKSMPVCFKIKVEGRAPQFVSPTPMEANSFDDKGLLVPHRTDVHACEGYDLQLPIKAVDLDDDGVRIFVEDKDKDERVASPLDLLLAQDESDFFSNKTYNLDFFDMSSLEFQPEAVGNSQNRNFEPYGGQRMGDNAKQRSILPLDPKGAKSIRTGYAPEIVYKNGTAEQKIVYKLDVSRKNGIVIRLASNDSAYRQDEENCMVGDDIQCRERIVNMDQTVCAFAYDNSRYMYKRWVGKSDPNGKGMQFCSETGVPFGTPKESSARVYVAGDTENLMSWTKQCRQDPTTKRTIIRTWMRDHSNGDMASPMHCWRIRLQAPPAFVTDAYKISTPFPDSYSLTAFNGSFAFTSKTALITKVEVFIRTPMSWTFVAQDPNFEDTVEILILDDPGLPPEMRASMSSCIPRFDEMYAARDEGWEELPTEMRPKRSPCSKSKLELTWNPPPETAGQIHRVCAVAKDTSSACVGLADSGQATSRGWFGEVHCIDFHVYKPSIRFDLGFLPMEIDSFVGCQTQINLSAVDCSMGSQPCKGSYRVKMNVIGVLPEGAHLTEPENGEGVVGRVFKWVPRRGMEGRTFTACFTAVDFFETQAPTAPECFNMTVQKCQYCIGARDTLSLLMKDYGLDTNWLRVWLHNGNNGPVEKEARISNPDLIVHTREVTALEEMVANSRGQPIVWAGLMYRVGIAESLTSVAARFRTSVGSLLSVNPDIIEEDDVQQDSTTLCVIPCGQSYSEITQRAA